MLGNFGKYIDIDLSSHTIREYPIPEEWYEKHIGGSGIAGRILLKELDPKTDPLSDNNILVMATGPLCGLGVAGSSRMVMMGKSPKNNSINDSYVGGKMGDVLGKSGYDGIIIRGKSPDPVYIELDNGHARIISAEDLWGLDPYQLEERLIKNNRNVSIASIGKAGENQVIPSCVIIDRNRALGRPGFGAVMGAKNLKAIVVKGNLSKKLANQDKFKELKLSYARQLMSPNNPGTHALGKLGTAGGTHANSQAGNLPTKNFQSGQYYYSEQITGKTLVESEIWVKRDTCTGCPVACKRVVQGTFNNQEFGPQWGGPEYETIGAFGSMLLINDLSAISLFNKKCNQYGLDTISVGVNIAYLMEATERGLLKDEDRIAWGDTEAVDKLIEKIVNREGTGDWIARGVDYLIKKVGDGSFFVHTKNQETPMHDPRVKYSLALYYASSPKGSNHMNGVHDPTPPHRELKLPDNPRNSWKDRARIAGEYLRLRSFTNSLILCALISDITDRGSYLIPLVREMLAAATGKEISVKEMLEIGERNEALLRIFAERVGYTRKDDYLPKRLLEAQASTGFSLDEEMVERTIDDFYRLYGYGIYGPTEEKIKELKLLDV